MNLPLLSMHGIFSVEIFLLPLLTSNIHTSTTTPPHLQLEPMEKITLVKQVNYHGQTIEAAWPLGAAINDLATFMKP